MHNVSFSDQEIQVLVQLIDLAVKANGLPVAEAAVVLSRRLTDAAKADKPKSEGTVEATSASVS